MGQNPPEFPLSLKGSTVDRRVFLSVCSTLAVTSRRVDGDQQKQIDVGRLITQLGSRSFQEREKASKTLEGLGEAILPALRSAAQHHNDVEVRHRAGALVKSIKKAASGEAWCFAGHTRRVNAVALSGDGRHTFSAGFDGTIRVCDAATGVERRRLRIAPLQVWSLGVSLDGAQVFTGNANGTISVWNLKAGVETRQLRGSRGFVWSVALSRNGQRLLSGSHDGTVRLWDLSTGKQLRAIATARGGLRSHVYDVAFSPDGKQLLACTGGEIEIRGLSGKVQNRLRGAWPGMKAEFAPDAHSVFSGGDEGTVRVWALPVGRELEPFRPVARSDRRDASRHEVRPEANVVSLAVSRDGRRLVSGHLDGTIRFWDVATRRELRCSARHTRRVGTVVCSHDGKWALSGSDDCTVRFWRMPL